MAATAMVIGLLLAAIYVAAGIYSAKIVRALIKSSADWIRNLAGAAILAVFFAPAFVAGGHGVGIAPAWVALLDTDSNRFIISFALQSLAGTWIILFVAGVIISKIKKAPQ